MGSEDRYLSKAETAQYLSVCLRTIDHLIRDGQLPTYRLRGRVIFRKSELDAFVAARRVGPLRGQGEEEPTVRGSGHDA